MPALTIPAVAIQMGSRGSFVYVAEDGKVRMQLVTPGLTDGDRVAIEQGLKAGDAVVTEGVDRLRDGAAVQVVPAGQETATPPRKQP
jgi:multidrug efflux system membrane fusion protein